MKNTSQHPGLLRIGVFYDGTYLSHVSNYYLYEHERRARLSIGGLHEFIREQVAQQESVEKRFCQIVDAHYFRGRLPAKLAQAQDVLFRERQFDDVLIREGVTLHFLPVTADAQGDISEKGIDVWFALEAFELAVQKHFDVTVLITGDGDFVPLVRKLNTLGTRVMLLAWDFEFQREGRTIATRTSQALINEATYPVMMADEIDSRGRQRDSAVAQIFVQRVRDATSSSSAPEAASTAPANRAQDDPQLLMQASQGTIANVNTDKGYGFIRPEGAQTNLFFHFSALQNCELADLSAGSPVRFRVISTERGPNAVEIHLRDEGGLPAEPGDNPTL
ncbi:MAG: cold-shock protein [Ideonella sp. MAG2]|nr:MAG: cold-shock protein [Ideonella sp. MAG2]